MVRRAGLLGLLALAACSTAGGGGGAGQAPDTAVARFVPGGEVTVIEVTVSDRRPLRGADLLGPENVVIPAYSIDAQLATQAVGAAAPGVMGLGVGAGFGGGHGEFGSGVGLAFTLGGYGAPGTQLVSTGQIQSTALIRLPRPENYRQTWRDWKVRLRIGDPPNVTFLTLAAPQPPPGVL